MHVVLGVLGSPHAGLPVVHRAGTKGKGLVVTMLSAILQEAGYKVGTYTRHEVSTFIMPSSGTSLHKYDVMV